MIINKLLRHNNFIFIALILITGCSEIKTDSAIETYRYWAGTDSIKDIGILNGQYWQSSHWSKEYIVFLKIKPTKQWWNSFIKQNQLLIDKRNWTKPDDSPFWFNPTDNSQRFSDGKDFDQGTRYIYDSITGIAYIYEIQL